MATSRALPAAVLVALMGVLAVLWGCQKQITTFRGGTPEIRPSSSTARLVQNAAYLRQSGRLELAVEELEEAHLREPENLEILDVMARCYEELGHFDRAQELYDEALSRGHHPALENNLCYSLYLRGRLGRAEACFRETLARDPDNQMARNNLGLVLCRQGREAEALALWQEVLSESESRERLGQALAALGRGVPPNMARAEAAPAEERAAATASAAVSPVPEASGPRAQFQDRQERQRDFQAQASPRLTAVELLDTGIELKNGNGAKDFARIMRRRLSSEGFTVVGIGNHIDFGLEETIIAHRTKAARVAQVLAQKFFPGAKLEANGDISPRADIRVSLGRDMIPSRGQLAKNTP
ncbi:MAG: LytR C-terminal domain-containing protein [Syntrophobacterales bacterium]